MFPFAERERDRRVTLGAPGKARSSAGRLEPRPVIAGEPQCLSNDSHLRRGEVSEGRRHQEHNVGRRHLDLVDEDFKHACVADNCLARSSGASGRVLSGVGAAMIGSAIGIYGISPDLAFEKRVNALVAEGGSSADVLRRIDTAWDEAAQEVRAGRIRGGVVGVVLGALVAGTGVALEFAVERSRAGHGFPEALVGGGAAFLAVGVYRLTVESSFESSHRTWKRLRDPAAQATSAQPTLGVALAPGGGSVTVGLAF